MLLVLLEVKRVVRTPGKDDYDGGDDDLEVVMMVVMLL